MRHWLVIILAVIVVIRALVYIGLMVAPVAA
jgi:hypothetical protein